MYYMLDNYDSFVYNLSAYLREAGQEVLVRRADEASLSEIYDLRPDGIILSPGPKRPADAVESLLVLKEFQNKIPILGVCLGHQAICEAFGGSIVYAPELMHGKQYVIKADNETRLFQGLPAELKVARYHSLAVDKNNIPEELVVTAVDEKGVVMALQHKMNPVYGVQFHPESIMTPYGKKLIDNFLKIV